MSDNQLYTVWGISLVVATVVILLAAALLIAILLVARRILSHGTEGLDALGHIADDTRIIWALAETTRLAEEILGVIESIGSRGGRILEGLHGAHGSS